MSFFLKPDLSLKPKVRFILNGNIIENKNISLIDNRIQECIKEGFNSIELDFSNVEYINSTGIGGIINLYKNARVMEHEFFVINPQSHIRKIFLNLQIDKLFLK